MRATFAVLILAMPASPASADDEFIEPGPRPRTTFVAPRDPMLPLGVIRQFGSARWRHPGGINGSAMSADGTMLATAGPRSVVIWDTASGMALAKFDTGDGLKYSTQKLSFSPDGKRLAVCTDRSQICLFHLREQWGNEERLQVTPRPGQSVRPDYQSAFFTEDGANMIVGQADLIGFHPIGTSKTRLASFSGNAKLFAPATSTVIGLEKGKPVFFDLTGHRLAEPETETEMDGLANGLALSPNGRQLAVYRKYGEIEVWSVPHGNKSRTFKVKNAGAYHTVAFSADGKTLLFGSVAGVERWNVAFGDLLPAWECKFDPDFGRLTGLHTSPKGDLLFACCEDGRVRRYLWNESRELDDPEVPAGRAAVAANRDGTRILIGDRTGRAAIWDAGAGRKQTLLSDSGNPVSAVALTHDARWAAIGRTDGDLSIIEVATGRKLPSVSVPLNARFGPIREVFFRPDGKTVLARAWGGPLRSWSIPDGVAGWSRRSDAYALAPDGLTIFACSGGELQFTSIADGAIRKRVSIAGAEQPNAIGCLAASPDGRWLAVGVGGGTLRFLDQRTGEEKAKVEAINLPSDPSAAQLLKVHWKLTALAFSPDGKWLASGGDDTTVRVFETATWTELRKFRGHEKRVTFVSFGPDGRSVISAGEDGAVYEWNLRPKPDRVPEPWEDLGSTDPLVADRAFWSIVDKPGRIATLLREHLQPVKAESPDRIAKLIADLGSPRFATRESAMAALRELGGSAETALKEASERRLQTEALERIATLKTANANGPTGEALRRSRAVKALELAGTAAARELLRELAGGANGAALTEDAAAALGRLSRR